MSARRHCGWSGSGGQVKSRPLPLDCPSRLLQRSLDLNCHLAAVDGGRRTRSRANPSASPAATTCRCADDEAETVTKAGSEMAAASWDTPAVGGGTVATAAGGQTDVTNRGPTDGATVVVDTLAGGAGVT